MAKKKVILDVDPGIDDALAIELAVNSPEIELLGITTVAGNVPVERGCKNALRTLEYLGVEGVKVYKGARKPLVRELVPGYFVHGKDGLGEAGIPEARREPEKEPAPFFIVETIESLGKGEVTIVATGPLTNIALALATEPSIAEMVSEIVIMGGAYGLTPLGIGNATQVSEFNIWSDPEAAHIVFSSGAKIYAVGLDVTMHPDSAVTREVLERIASSSDRRAEFAAKILRFPVEKFGVFHLHDPIALSVCIDRDLFKFEDYNVEVSLTWDATRGQTIVERRELFGEKFSKKPNASVAVKLRAKDFLKMFLSRIGVEA